jgi:DNA-binding MarR family transcriptional regulator
MSTVLDPNNSGGSSPLQETLGALDEVIHQKVRLGVMSALMAAGEADFRSLKETLGLTDGNLSIHVAKLEEAGYITVRKEFVRKKTHTSYTATERGREAFRAYLAALERIVRAASQFPGGES